MRSDTYKDDQTRNKGTVLVFGATGKQGGAVAAALRSDGWAVRALIRRHSVYDGRLPCRMSHTARRSLYTDSSGSCLGV
ncbi:NmrA family NAD(P)-binding protein [Halodurantibacterium flavum]|uniref:NmrA family NAD(P)-binding protein n=1 Tax=Halodurantibacterium flavum TaxID=1382802 RepID=A0ABW4S8P7_9RHOB